MKKQNWQKWLSFLLGTFCLLALAACGPQEETSSGPETTLAQVDEATLQQYVEKPEIALGESFVFQSAAELATQQLFDFYLATVDGAAAEEYLQEDQLYHIPTAAITKFLDQYFVDYQFDPTELGEYNMAEDTVDVAGLIVAEGNEVTVVSSQMEDTQQTIVIQVANEAGEELYQKTYVLTQTDNGMQYDSVTLAE